MRGEPIGVKGNNRLIHLTRNGSVHTACDEVALGLVRVPLDKINFGFLCRLCMESAPAEVLNAISANGIHNDYKKGSTEVHNPRKPSIGSVVVYESKNGDGIKSPAIVLRTRDTTDPALIERWGPGPDGTLSGVGKPADLVAELSSDFHVDLLVHGLGGDYREYNVPHTTAQEGHRRRIGAGEGSPTARTWSWVRHSFMPLTQESVTGKAPGLPRGDGPAFA